MLYTNITHFKGLNALRFFAAYLVVLHHAETIRQKYGLFNIKAYSFFNNGSIAVTFFFVLSGFLISYLLLKEEHFTKKISIKNFYIKRVLRIWPLYYLLVFIGLVVVPFFIQKIGYNYEMPYNFKEVILYFVFFCPFLVNILFGHHLLEPLWSIGVEEIFYLIWAPVLKFFKKYILIILIGIILLKITASSIFYFGGIENIYTKVISMLKFEAMAIGGLGAYFIFNRKKEICKSMFFSKLTQSIIIIFLLMYLFASNFLSENTLFFRILFKTPVLSDYLLMLSFIWLIINISLNKFSFISLNNKTLDYFGEISYGIYMYHMIIIFSVVLILKNFLNNLDNTISTIIFYSIVTTLVLFVSFLSKTIFENYFLNLKKKFNS